MSDSFYSPSSFRSLLEKIKAETEVYQVKLPVTEKELEPVLSVEAVELHYGTLYKNYVRKSLAGEGEFHTAGAKLHSQFFEQFQKPALSNLPVGASKELIEKKYGSFAQFKESFLETALSIQGSGWVYLDTYGTIKTIKDHKIVPDVALIMDMWEHSFIIDYGADKKKYVSEMWKIINWSIINLRIK